MLIFSSSPDGQEEVIIPKFVFDKLLASALSKVHVDESWYKEKYPDVTIAVESGTFADGRAHYISYGYKENRIPHEILVNEEFYLEINEDVAKAISDKKFDSAQEHFEQAGYEEGREPWPNFSLF